MYTQPAPHQPYAPPPRQRWWQHPALIIAALVLLPPVGIALAWMSPWAQGKKIVATVIAGVWFLVLVFSDGGERKTDDGKAQAGATASATPPSAAAPAPSQAPVTDAAAPTVVGQPFSQAEKAVEDLIDGELTALSAYTDVPLPSAHATWVVCFQSPDAGKPLAKSAAATVHLVAPGTKCPATADSRLHAETPKTTPTPTPTQESNGSSDGGSSTTGGGGSAYYKNCDAAKAAGAAPIRRGQPGYRSALDRDGDGIACDK
ncbi:excalibur calcium-binding domain-containing protein [Streptomyces sp. NPDC057011]|uniref:excalibur calcium-binding domain-containing protein n=1 Tax=unclassified Streptomyces TaxID=2593676 RepID=UPI0036418D44